MTGKILLLSGLLIAVLALALPAQTILINESDADTPGTDTLEFVELWDGGIGFVSLAGYVLVFFNGNGDVSYAAHDLATFSTDVNGFFLAGNAALSPAPALVFPNNGLQNGEDAIALYQGSIADFPNGTAPGVVVGTSVLVDAVVYDTNDPVAAGLIAALTPGQPQINEGGGLGGSANDSIFRCPDGAGGPLVTNAYYVGVPSPGASNVPSCPAPNPFALAVTQVSCGNIDIAVTGASPAAEIYNFLSLQPAVPAGSGPFFGLEAGAAAGSPLYQIFLPLGFHPFHVLADPNGDYSLSIPTSGTCTPSLTVEMVSVEVTGFAVFAISPTTGAVTVGF
jgi:hypothetical protein